MEVTKIIEQIEDEISYCSRRLEDLYRMRGYFYYCIATNTTEYDEELISYLIDMKSTATTFEKDKEEEAYAAEERIAVAEDNATIISDSKPDGTTDKINII